MDPHSEESKIFVLAYYRFTPIADPHEEVALHKAFFKDRQLTSRIYISEQGINGQMSGIVEDAEAYMAWMHSRPLFEGMPFKIHTHHEQVFPRQTIKYRQQLVALDEEVNLANVGEHVSPEEWKRLMESEEKPLLLDIRNDYEWEVGRFEGAVCPPCKTFREFGQYVEELTAHTDPAKTAVMMYCTGGIRCELYSSLLLKRGFEKVYQLEGGIINYGALQGSAHWLGKLFVFDDRLTVSIAEEATPVIGICRLCQTAADDYYNCANMDCNELFLCCPDCLERLQGCCCDLCRHAPRLRPYSQAHKPFRRRHCYTQTNCSCS